MFIKTLRILIHADNETVWKVLVNRVMNPQDHIMGVTKTNILEESENMILREVTIHGIRVREKVTVNHTDREVKHEILDHPAFTGTIDIKIVPTARQSPVAPQHLEYHVNLLRKSLQVTGVMRGEEEAVIDFDTELKDIKARAEAAYQ